MKRGTDSAIYVLRQFSVVKQTTEDGEQVDDPQNHVLGDLVETAPDSCIFIFRFGQGVVPDPGTVYQIYSKHEVTRSRYLYIPDNAQLFVFLIQKNRIVHYTGHKTDSVDVPPHFLIQSSTDGVLVVTASDEKSAREKIVNGTDLKFAEKGKKKKKNNKKKDGRSK